MGSGDTNPFSRQSLINKRKEIVAQLREDRSNEQPREEASQTQVSEPPEQSVSPQKEDSGQDSRRAEERGSDPVQSKPEASSPHQADFERRERELLSAQERVRNASTDAEKRSARAEEDEKKAQAALQKLKWAKSDPVGFLAEIGMTEPEWKEFLANGGKPKPEVERMKAMEAKFSEMEERYRKLEAKAEASARKSAIDQENAAFAPQLKDYVFVPKILNMDQVRIKQHELSQAQGSQVSLKHAADVLEEELEKSLKPLLKHEDVLRKLGIGNRDQQSVDKPPQVKTQNGTPAKKEIRDPEPEPEIEPWNWAEKKRRALKTLKRASL